ncbi:hypothetical protein BY458DRAFT_589082 [Sporodiniella umbellata]|nr:hypothetical protein BY458DRAFT_589082 [Sporodiniella umbellata]
MSRLKSKYSSLLKEQGSFSSEEEEEEEDQYDSGVIRCVCDDPSDDGFTIQCEHCLDWQHASCVNVKRNKIPKHYLCDRCSRLIKKKRPLDFQNRSKEAKDKKKETYRKYSFEESRGNNASYHHTSKCIVKQKTVANIFKEVRHYWFQVNKQKTPVTLDAATKKGLKSLVVMESNLLLPSIPKASAKPLRRLMRNTLNNEKSPLADKGVFADIHIPEDRYLMEIMGEVKLKSEYKASNYFSLLGAPLRHVFFYRSIDAYMDTREFGNDARFIRRSCKPNAEIKSIILPNDNEDLLIHMGVYTTEELDKGEEITVGWNWQRGLLLHKMHQEFLKAQDGSESRKTPIEPETRKALKKSIRLLEAEYGECGCEDKDDCFIEYLKDQLEADSDSETPQAEPIQTTKKKRPGRPRLPSQIDMSVHSSDEEHTMKIKKRAFVFEEESPIKKFAKETILKEDIMAPRILFGKKKWLQLFLSQQREKEKIVMEDTPMEEASNYFSDASSESTLPLTDDTRETAFDESTKEEDTHTHEMPADTIEPSTDTKQVDLIQHEEPLDLNKPDLAKESIQQESSSSSDKPEEPKIESSSKPAPRVKLSIQEYLSMRRNLSTN